MGFWQEQALLYERKQLHAKKGLEEGAISEIPSLPAGVGKLTWRPLCGEILTWTFGGGCANPRLMGLIGGAEVTRRGGACVSSRHFMIPMKNSTSSNTRMTTMASSSSSPRSMPV